jgi:hypothetical protein
MIYYYLEPFGETQSEYRAALVASMVANTARDPKKRSDPFQAVDFMRSNYLNQPLSDQQRPEKPVSDNQNSKNISPDLALFEKAKLIFGRFPGGIKLKGK